MAAGRDAVRGRDPARVGSATFVKEDTVSGNYTVWTIVGVLAIIALLIFIF